MSVSVRIYPYHDTDNSPPEPPVEFYIHAEQVKFVLQRPNREIILSIADFERLAYAAGFERRTAVRPGARPEPRPGRDRSAGRGHALRTRRSGHDLQWHLSAAVILCPYAIDIGTPLR